MTVPLDLYDRAFGDFFSPVQTAVRRETYGEDLGQTSWITAPEWLRYAEQLAIGEGSDVLEVGSGSGGPAIYLAEKRGCRITGVDVNAHGVANGARLARMKGVDDRARFLAVQSDGTLPFAAAAFDVVISNDVICHLPSRLDALREWRRVLRPGGRLLYTDALVVTGPITNDEIATRSAIGFYMFVPRGENERVIEEAELTLLAVEDTTSSPAVIAGRRRDARERHRPALVESEGEGTFTGLQRYLDCVSRLAVERRLSRFAFLAERPCTPD
ncbi:MAG: class I SAM-dependent methyltransferase [Gemmatimonadota bacterium]|nr:class I SAM-dependent methyltransferase [Gemmatimonadota bacterium]